MDKNRIILSPCEDRFSFLPIRKFQKSMQRKAFIACGIVHDPKDADELDSLQKMKKTSVLQCNRRYGAYRGHAQGDSQKNNPWLGLRPAMFSTLRVFCLLGIVTFGQRHHYYITFLHT